LPLTSLLASNARVSWCTQLLCKGPRQWTRPFIRSHQRTQEYSDADERRSTVSAFNELLIEAISSKAEDLGEKKTVDRWESKSSSAMTELALRPPVKAYSGRSVRVKDGNVADAYIRLQGILQRNKVRTQLSREQRHEKKGEKRRRLDSERWRRQFAHEVRNKVQLVTKIRNRGA